MTNFVIHFVLNLFAWAFGQLSNMLLAAFDENKIATAVLTFATLFLMIAVLWISIATSVKRAHDFGRSFWFVILPWLALILGTGVATALSIEGHSFDDLTVWIILPAILYFIATMMILLFRAGDKFPNPFGPVPLPFSGRPSI